MQKEKSKYNSFREWSKAEPKAYRAAKEKGLLEEIKKEFDWEMQADSINNTFKVLQTNRNNVDKNNINDFYENFRNNISFLNEEIGKFLGPTKNDNAALRARKILRDLEDDVIILRKLIQINRKSR